MDKAYAKKNGVYRLELHWENRKVLICYSAETRQLPEKHSVLGPTI